MGLNYALLPFTGWEWAQVLALSLKQGVREKRERGDRKKKAEQRETKLREREERDDEKGEQERRVGGEGSE